MTDPTPNGFMSHDEDYVPNVPNPRKRKDAREVPRAARTDDIDASMSRIVDGILRRDKWLGRRRGTR